MVLTLTASGSVSDYSDTSYLRNLIAANAGVDAASVSIHVAAASVIITATIAVPASTTPAAVQATLFSTLGTAASASAALGITVESDPSITGSNVITDDTAADVASTTACNIVCALDVLTRTRIRTLTLTLTKP